MINEKSQKIGHIQTKDYNYEYMVRHHTCIPSVGSIISSKVLKHPVFTEADPRDTSFRWLGDFSFWLKLGLVSDMFRVDSTLAMWRKRTGQASGEKSSLRAAEHVRLIDEYYQRPDIPLNIQWLEKEARCWAALVAAAVTDSRKESLAYISKAFRAYPGIIGTPEFYHIIYNRLKTILEKKE